MINRWKEITRGVGLLGLVLLAPAVSRAGIALTVNAPGIQESLEPGVITETFDTALTPPGYYNSINSPVGFYTTVKESVAVVLPDAYGGAHQTNYITVGDYAESARQVTLSFSGAQAYFGFYFSAIDATNLVTIYDGATPLIELSATNIVPLLLGNPAYYGNPNNGENPSEPYVYVNVYGTAGQTFDRVVFRNASSSGLESDNHSIRGALSVPEPSSLAAATLGALCLLCRGARKRSARYRQASR
jgi:PEP-CTERM motif